MNNLGYALLMQGVSDQIMFASCLSELTAITEHITPECKLRFAARGDELKIGIPWKAGIAVDHKKRSKKLKEWLPILKFTIW